MGLGGGCLRGEFAEEAVGADMAGVVLEGGAIRQARKKITDCPTHPLLLDAQGSPIRDEMRMKMIKFEETLEDLAGALVDLANSRVVVKIFVEESSQVLDFDAHGQSEGDKAAGVGLGVGRRGRLSLGKARVGGAGSVLDEQIGQAAGDVAARAFGVEAGVIFANGGFGFFPKFDREEGGGIDQAAFEGVFEVMAGVGDLVGQIDDLGFEGRVEAGAGEGIDPEPNFVSEVESVKFGVFDLELFDHAEALATAPEAAGVSHELIEGLFDGVSEGGMSEIAGEGDGFGEVFVQAKRAAEGAGERSDLDRVGEASADVIAGAVEGELGFIFERAESGAVHDAFAIALKFRAKIVGLFGVFAAEALLTFGGVATEEGGLLFFPVGSGADWHSSGMDGRGGESRDGEN